MSISSGTSRKRSRRHRVSNSVHSAPFRLVIHIKLKGSQDQSEECYRQVTITLRYSFIKSLKAQVIEKPHKCPECKMSSQRSDHTRRRHKAAASILSRRDIIVRSRSGFNTPVIALITWIVACPQFWCREVRRMVCVLCKRTVEVKNGNAKNDVARARLHWSRQQQPRLFLLFHCRRLRSPFLPLDAQS